MFRLIRRTRIYKSWRQLTFPQSKRRRTSASKLKAEAESDSDDAPLLSKSSGRKPSIVKKPPTANETALGLSSDSDVPLTKKLSDVKTKIEQRAEKEAKAIRKEESKAASGSAKKKIKTEDTPPKPKKKQTNGVKKEEPSDDDMPLSKKKAVKKATKSVKSEPSTPAKKSAKDKEKDKAAKVEKEEDAEEDEEKEQRWWEKYDEDGNKLDVEDDTIKWNTFQHNGVVFPPAYEPLPKKVKMLYDGVPVSMAPEAEEIAGFFGAMLHSTINVENPTFQKNFFHDFKESLKSSGGAKDKDGNKVPIKEFSKCDFKPIQEYYVNKKEEEKAHIKSLSRAEKAALKAEKQAADAPYQHCTWDGRKQQVGNFRIEPPGLFRGRGDHPKTGTVKRRVLPNQVTINIGKEATVPPPPEGHKWKEVVHDQTKSYLASWVENVNGQIKYVQLHNTSDVKGMSDFNKFQKARELKVRPHSGYLCSLLTLYSETH
jgi:DNA topoisomerase I